MFNAAPLGLPAVEADVPVHAVIARMQQDNPGVALNPQFVSSVLNVYDGGHVLQQDEHAISDLPKAAAFAAAVVDQIHATQAGLGQLLDVSQSTINRLLNKNLSPSGTAASRIIAGLNGPINVRRVLFHELHQDAESDEDGDDLADIGDEKEDDLGFPMAPIGHPGLPPHVLHPPTLLPPQPPLQHSPALLDLPLHPGPPPHLDGMAVAQHPSEEEKMLDSQLLTELGEFSLNSNLESQDESSPIPPYVVPKFGAHKKSKLKSLPVLNDDFGDESAFGVVKCFKGKSQPFTASSIPSSFEDHDDDDYDIDEFASQLLSVENNQALKGYVYVMKELDRPDRIKIGQSRNPVARVQTMRVGNPEARGHVYYSFKDHRAAENRIHATLHGLGRGIRGEWFSITPTEGAAIVKWFHDNDQSTDGLDWPMLPTTHYPKKTVFHITVRVQTEQSPETPVNNEQAHVHTELVIEDWSNKLQWRDRCKHQKRKESTPQRPRGGCNFHGKKSILCKYSHDLP